MVDEGDELEGLRPQTKEEAREQKAQAGVMPQPNDQSNFYETSISPSFQHDVAFVGTRVASPGYPTTALMPLGLQANPISNAAIASTAKAAVGPPVIPPPFVPEVCVHLKTGTDYRLQLIDRSSLVVMDNNAGGTIELPATHAPIPGGVFIQSTGSGSGSDTTSVTITCTQGSTVFVTVKSGSGIATLPTINDTQAHTWILVDGSFDSGGIPTRMWYAPNMSAGSNTISATLLTAGFMIMTVVEFGGMPLSASLDQHASNVSNAVGTIPSPQITTGVANALVLGSFINGGGSGVTFTAVAPYVQRWTFTDQFVESALVAASGTITQAIVTSSPNVSTCVAIVASFATLTEAAEVGFPKCWFAWISNIGTGTFTVSSSAQIDESNTPLSLGPGQGILVAYDGFNWFTVRGLGSAGILPQTLVSVDGLFVDGYDSTTGLFSVSSAYNRVQSNSVDVPKEHKLNFGPAFTVTDNSGNSSTDIDLAVAAAAVEINGVGVSSDKQFFINGVFDGSAPIWTVQINGVSDGG